MIVITIMQRITPFIWFEENGEQAVKYYVEVFSKYFKNTKITTTTYYDEVSAKQSNRPVGSVLTVGFTIDGMEFSVINGGPFLKLSGAVSFVVNCKNQEEVDYFWDKLGEGGEKGQCGWINRDKFGMTWQVVPVQLMELISGSDKEKAGRAMVAMLKMTKIIIKDIEDAAHAK